jgi:aspartate carbamoyltransferase
MFWKDSLVSVDQLDKYSISEIFSQTDLFKISPFPCGSGDKVFATMFFEPSTRTRLSFESAIVRHDYRLITVENGKVSSSDKKGESLEDCVKTVSQYVDCIILRHPEKGAAKRAAKVSDVPIINAGDGDGEHPTQSLLDMYTIYENKKTDKQNCWSLESVFEPLNVLFYADLENARTVNSLEKLLSLYGASVEKRSLFDDPNKDKDLWKKADVVYITRLQKERKDPDRPLCKIPQNVVNEEILKSTNENCIFLHPLPRCGEVDPAIDKDERVLFWPQVKNGMYTRMALISMMNI